MIKRFQHRIPNYKSMLVMLVLFSFLYGCKPGTTDLYVYNQKHSLDSLSGKVVLNSIDDALEKVIELRKDKNKNTITIHLLEGEYRLSSPLRIGPELGHLKIVGNGVEKTTIKGSKVLNLKWKKFNKQIWTAKIHDEDKFDQLFINGEKQILARYPNYNENGGHWQGHAADAISKQRISTWSNPVGAFLHVMHIGEWGDFHYKVTGIDENGEAILFGGHQNNRPSKMHEKYRMVENVFEELDSPGEWYLDVENNLFYWPKADMDMDGIKAEGVTQKHLFEIIGTEESPVVDVEIRGVKFEHTQRTIMEKYEPLLRSDWTMYRGGAIFIEGTKNVKLTDCEFTNLGGNVIFVSKFNRNTKISNNHIHDCGASAISFVGSSDAVRSPSFQYNEFVPLAEMDTIKGPKTNSYPSEAVVDNNLIYRIGRLEKQTAGVQIAMAMNITVSNNSIYDVPRAGINIGDGTWGGHIIEYNDVFNTVLESGDHGAFNSWGRDRFWHPNREKMNSMVEENPQMPTWDAINTTIIRNNRFRCDHGWDIDLDDGSSNYHIYNNVCLNGGIKLREGFNRTVENNMMINNSFHPHVWFKKSGDVFKNNVVMTDYKDIRLSAWGKEVDSNLFPNEEALKKAQGNGTDSKSVYGNPMFKNPENGNYTLAENSPAFKIGFQNIPMDKFGVQKPNLKAIAKTPEFPVIWSVDDANSKESITMKWLGATIKNIETLEERSASGLKKTAGVIILKIEDNTVLSNSTIKVGDVIIEGEGENIKNIQDLMKVFQGYNWIGHIKFKIFRNQKPLELTVSTKK